MLHFHRLIQAVLLAGWITTPIVAGQPAAGHSFDAFPPVWQLMDGSAARILAHDHVAGGARDEAGCERLVVATPAGQSALLQCAIARMAVLDELEARIWVKASRSDIQLAARVVLPRSAASDGGESAAAIVRGAVYDRPGHWQQLVLKGVPKLLAAEVRVMRAVPGAKIDPREAFVDAIVLLVPGDSHGVEVLTDELQVEGIVLSEDAGIQLTSFPAPPPLAVAQPSAATAVFAGEPRREESAIAAANDSPVRMRGSLLLADGKPLALRAIQWQGEPLQFLAERGFNAIQLQSPPTAEQSIEAQRHALWFVGAPPSPEEIRRHGLGRPDDRVLAWYLNDGVIETDRQYGRLWAELVRQHDAVSGRPIIFAPEADWQAAGKTADILLARHLRAGRIAGQEYDAWLAARTALMRPGMPFWASVPTQFGEEVRQQSAALTGTPAPFAPLDAEQVETLQQIALTRGCRGIVFGSHAPLNEASDAARRRAATLELINRRLQLVEPWMAGGKVVGWITAADPAWTGAVLHADGARLLIPVAAATAGDGASSSTRAPAAADLTFIVPGVPESSRVFLISPVAFRPLSVQRVAGGTRIVVPAQAHGMVLMTEDPQVVHAFRQRIARDGPRVARLQLELAEQQMMLIDEVGQDLTQLGYSNEQVVLEATAAAAQLRECTALLSAGRIEPAHQLAEAVSRSLARAAAQQRRIVETSPRIQSSPLALGYDQLAEHARFLQWFHSLQDRENLLYGGDFEDLGQLTQLGWQHVRHPLPGIDAGARLSTREPQHGHSCLELFATASSPNGAPRVVSPPVWIISPAVPVEEGQLLEISGWVRIEEPVDGSFDGLQIVDSLGGAELSLAIRKTSGWQPFQMVRGVPQSTELRLTFALTGLGSACIDGVMVRTLEQPIARRLPAVSPPDATSGIDTVAAPRPLFVAPQTR